MKVFIAEFSALALTWRFDVVDPSSAESEIISNWKESTAPNYNILVLPNT